MTFLQARGTARAAIWTIRRVMLHELVGLVSEHDWATRMISFSPPSTSVLSRRFHSVLIIVAAIAISTVPLPFTSAQSYPVRHHTSLSAHDGTYYGEDDCEE